MMFATLTLITTLLASARAFTSQHVAFKARATTTPPIITRLLLSSSSADPMPYDDDKMPFYALGMNLGLQASEGSWKSILNDDELDIVLEAFGAHLCSDQDPRPILDAYGQQLNALLNERTTKMMDGIKQDGQDFIAEFLSANPKATKTDSGLVFCETTAGTGESPTAESTVEVHYHGTLADGTVFDSSVERGETINFPLNGVIKGWTEGLQLMKEGGKATLVVPSDLAYGDAGSGGVIAPGATLQFEVELFKVVSSESDSNSNSQSSSQEEEETVVHELPDGQKIRLPKGVKMRLVDADEAASS